MKEADCMNEDIVVSVWCLTYNHVGCIRDALEGIIMQQTNFRFNVLVYDDASNDGTSDIVREYAEKYPDIIHAVIAEENTWHNPRRNRILMELKKKYLVGKYIAHCEGDDFWIDCHKLQIQVGYMESHPECSMYLHNALWLNCQNGSIKAGNPFTGYDEQDVSAEEVIMQYNRNPPTASFVYRKENLFRPQFFDEAPVGDYTTLLYALLKGNIHYNSRIMSVYRWLGEGSYNVTLQKDRNLQFNFNMGIMDFCIKYDRYTDFRYHIWCQNRIQKFFNRILSSVGQTVLLSDCLKESRAQGYALPKECNEYISELELIRKQIFNIEYISDDLRKFVNGFKHIIIMGAGNFASIIARKFECNDIVYDGFAVTQKTERENFYMGKPIWNMSELPYSKAGMGVVVGINPIRWDTIVNSLENAQITNYFCPFLVDGQKILHDVNGNV